MKTFSNQNLVNNMLLEFNFDLRILIHLLISKNAGIFTFRLIIYVSASWLCLFSPRFVSYFLAAQFPPEDLRPGLGLRSRTRLLRVVLGPGAQVP